MWVDCGLNLPSMGRKREKKWRVPWFCFVFVCFLFSFLCFFVFVCFVCVVVFLICYQAFTSENQKACPLTSASALYWSRDTIREFLQSLPNFGSGGIEKSHSCKWAKWIQWHALPHIQQSTQQRNKGYYPNLHGWDFSIPPSPEFCSQHEDFIMGCIIWQRWRGDENTDLKQLFQ